MKSRTMQGFQTEFIDKVNERANGQLVIDYRGGPEVIVAFDQGKAIKDGITDIGNLPVGFYEPLVPGVGGAMLTRISLEEEMKPGGAFDYLVEMHKQGGLMYLGRGNATLTPYFYTFLNKKLEKPADFKGFRMGTETAGRAAVEAWGCTIVSLAGEDEYTAMERGLVDGMAAVGIGSWVADGTYEVTKYVLDHPFYANTLAIIMNLDSWNSLPGNLQKIVLDTVMDYDKFTISVWDSDVADYMKTMRDAGVEIYKLAPDVEKWYLDTAYNSAWDYQQERFPEVTKKLRSLLAP